MIYSFPEWNRKSYAITPNIYFHFIHNKKAITLKLNLKNGKRKRIKLRNFLQNQAAISEKNLQRTKVHPTIKTNSFHYLRRGKPSRTKKKENRRFHWQTLRNKEMLSFPRICLIISDPQKLHSQSTSVLHQTHKKKETGGGGDWNEKKEQNGARGQNRIILSLSSPP